jgi:hypothetical protein
MLSNFQKKRIINKDLKEEEKAETKYLIYIIKYY